MSLQRTVQHTVTKAVARVAKARCQAHSGDLTAQKKPLGGQKVSMQCASGWGDRDISGKHLQSLHCTTSTGGAL